MTARSELPAVLRIQCLLWAIAARPRDDVQANERRHRRHRPATAGAARGWICFPGIWAKEFGDPACSPKHADRRMLNVWSRSGSSCASRRSRIVDGRVLRLSAEGQRANRRARGTVEAAIAQALAQCSTS